MKVLVLCVILFSVTCTENVVGIRSGLDSLKSYGQVKTIDDFQNYGAQQYDEFVEGLDKYDDNNKYFYDRRYDAEQYDKYEGPKELVLSNNEQDRYKDNNRFRNVYDGVDKCYDSINCRDNKDRVYNKDDSKNRRYDNNRNINYYSYNDRDWNDEDIYSKANVVGLEKNNREDIVRPCALDDRQCIRKYLAENSNCKPTDGPVPDPLYLNRNSVYLPFVNLTVVLTRLRITGLGRIKINEFYINKDTGNLVLALDFQKLNLTSPNAYFRYKRTAKETIVLNDFATAEIQSGTFTAVIPKIPHLRLDLAEIHADIDDIAPPFTVGPRAVNKDPDVASAFAQLLLRLPTGIQETFLFLSQLLTSIYIQENICDFGLKINSI